MADMTWGAEYTWPVLPAGHWARQARSCQIGDNKFVIAYVFEKAGNPANKNGRALVGVVSDSAISFGSDAVFYTSCHHYGTTLGICKLEDDKFVVVYVKDVGGVNKHLYARVGTVVGDVITWGTEVDISGSDAENVACCSLASDKFAVTYNDEGAGDEGTACICTVSGTTITVGTPVIVRAGFWYLAASVKVDTDKFVVCFGDGSLLAAIVTVSGTVPSMGTPVTVHTEGLARRIAVDYLGNNKAVVVWNTSTPYVAARGLICILTVSGTTLSAGAIVESQAAAPIGQGPQSQVLCALDTSHFLLVYKDASITANPGTSRYGTVVDTTITLDGKETWYTPNGNSIGLHLIGVNKVVLPFIEGVTGPEKAIIGNSPVTIPEVTTDAATAVGAGVGTPNGTLDSDGGEACGCSFEWGETVAYGNITTPQSRETGQTFSQALDGLDPDTTYHFRAVATNAAGTSYGSDLTFTTMAAPTVTTDAATAVGSGVGTPNGTLDDDGGEACDCGFEWGETVAYGNTTPTQNRETGQTFSQALAGLDPDTTYHFRAFATNSAGTGYGDDATFTTDPVNPGITAPEVSTDEASEVGQELANINGTLDNDGGEACECYLEWGRTTSYGTTIQIGSKTTGETFSQEISGLIPNTEYHFRAFATNSAGTSYGDDVMFTTQQRPLVNYRPIVNRSYALSRHEV